ncbi:hypothetical protein VaNZ11_007287 [Volvox africanus]|uniref:CBM20 domain-containing protein n=1 Tax=Volvox africanus TaxID=51714 RepID=A0ABQ5S2J7_9CHLO|nr:hypothetical protein VaNZ11_007287 [Volvox africanus]
MVQLSPWSNHFCGTAQRNVPLCRGPRSCARSTAVRCFKSGADEISNTPSSTLRLNFKIPYRVNYGQSLGLVGSGDSLGNWDPKRTVQMKWTDGDWWTVELNVFPGGPLDLEYKYVVVNPDGNIGYWKPGSNYRVTLPPQPTGTKVPKRVRVADAWDDSYKKVEVEEAEVQAGLPSASGMVGSGQPSAVPQQLPQADTWQKGSQQPSVAVPAPVSAAAASPVVPPISPPILQSSAPPMSTPLPVSLPNPVVQSPSVAEAKVSGNGTAPLSQTPAGASTQAVPQTTAPQPSGTLKPPSERTPPRATSPRAIPPNFAAATTIPVIHPSLLAEQERLEDGVRNSLEDLQAQMDKHQQLRERIDDPAAVEIIVADRIVAAANNRVVAYNKALKAVQDYNRLPPSASAPKETVAEVEK